MKSPSLVLVGALIGVSFGLLFGSQKVVRAQVPAPARTPFTFSILAPTGVRVPIGTVPPGFTVRMTGVVSVSGPGLCVIDRANFFEVGGNESRWTAYGIGGVNPAIPEPGLVFRGGETIAVGHDQAGCSVRFGLTGWIETVQ